MKIDFEYLPLRGEWAFTCDDKVLITMNDDEIDKFVEIQGFTDKQKFMLYCSTEVLKRIIASDKFIVEILFKHLFK